MLLNVVATTFLDLKKFLNNNFSTIEAILSDGSKFCLIDTSGNENYDERVLYFIEQFKDSFHYVSTLKSVKQAVGRNLALSEFCSSGYVWFVDSDDFLYKPVVDNSNADIIINDFLICQGDKQNKIVNGSKAFDKKNYQFLILTNRIPNSCWSYFYNVEFIKRNNITFENIFFEDLIFNSKAFFLANYPDYTGRTVYKYVVHEHSTTHSVNFEKRIQRIVASFIASKNIFLFSTGLRKYIFPFICFFYHGVWCNFR